ncbi:MAG TPA: methylated-DNA--[protein]-cysteine S-methyltransferase [bacterium]|nr:methylated-DNA--[protein]-cysteine S-methyltransferase [bacterium]
MRKKSASRVPVNYHVFSTAWGSAAIAWTERGVCGVVLPGPDERKIKAAILAEYPEAVPARPAPVADAVKEIKDYFMRRNPKFSARLDLSWATPFQARVYRAMLKIPAGRTISYGELAARIGSPGASRAVGAVNAANRIPLLIPCHRVIASSGALGGYSAAGGVKTKQRLLDLEKGSRPL